MLDENLPVFFYRRTTDGPDHHTAVLQAYQGSDPGPAYTLKHADPKLPASRNCYAAALFDSYNPDVLYGEVLVEPTWTKTTLSQEEIRRNGGVPPAPQAIIPGEFTIQLYEPDQQVMVRRKMGGLGSSTSYEFEMPQTSFRTPSTSTLDRTESDPAAMATTPKLRFVWRKEGKLSKDHTCYMTGKSTDAVSKKKNKDPDIAIALFRSLREVTIYEPNLSRVELEDLKGLEVVLLLSAIAFKDMYLSSNPREVFNIQDGPTRKLSAGGRKMQAVPSQNPPQPSQRVPTTVNPNVPAPSAHKNLDPALPNKHHNPAHPNRNNAPASLPPKDPRAQWEIDAETARLRAQVAREEKEHKRLAAQRQAEKAAADAAETQRLRKLVEAEQREARKKQDAVDKETERLRRKYGHNLPQLPLRPNSAAKVRPHPGHSQSQVNLAPPQQRPQQQRPASGGFMQAIPQGRPAPVPVMSGAVGGPSGGGMYLHPNQSTAPHGGAGQGQGQGLKGRKSFWGLKDLEEEMRKVTRKRSSLW